jgi:hypothetical protein
LLSTTVRAARICETSTAVAAPAIGTASTRKSTTARTQGVRRSGAAVVGTAGMADDSMPNAPQEKEQGGVIPF